MEFSRPFVLRNANLHGVAGITRFARPETVPVSAHDVERPPQVLPEQAETISSALFPSRSFEIIFKLPLQPPIKRIFETTPSVKSKSICTAQVFFVL